MAALQDKRRPFGPANDEVELNSDASFPASDAPSWTPVTGVGNPRVPAKESGGTDSDR
jgi:hypothetical protein